MEVKHNKFIIYYLPGLHGNYLEFICNKFFSVMNPTLTDFSPFTNIDKSLPFNTESIAHTKSQEYLDNRVFYEAHGIKAEYATKAITGVFPIIIHFRSNDLLSYIQRLVHLDGDLEINTYNKYKEDAPVNFSEIELSNLKGSFFTDQIRDSYNGVKDPSWPEVNTLEDYYNLPSHILDECQNIHSLRVLDFSETSPDCPRSILREFFKEGFKYPEKSFYTLKLKDRTKAIEELYSTDKVYQFEFSSLYGVSQFEEELRKLARYLNMKIKLTDEFYATHSEFLSKQPYRNSKKKCDLIVNDILHTNNQYLLSLTMLEESYVDAQLELLTCKEMPAELDQYFKTTQDIQRYLRKA